MGMKRWLGVIGALLALVWAPFVYRELSAEKPTSNGDGQGREFDEEGLPSLDELDAEVIEAPEPGAVADDEQPPAEGAGPGDELAEELALAEDEAEDEAEDPGPAEVLSDAPEARPVAAQRAFEQEPRDALWASGAERRLRQLVDGIELPAPEEEGVQDETDEADEEGEAVAEAADDEEAVEAPAPPAPPELKSVRCQQTLCRAEIGYDVRIAQAVTAQLHAQYGERLAGQPGTETDDERSMVVYVLREGYSWDDL